MDGYEVPIIIVMAIFAIIKIIQICVSVGDNSQNDNFHMQQNNSVEEAQRAAEEAQKAADYAGQEAQKAADYAGQEAQKAATPFSQGGYDLNQDIFNDMNNSNDFGGFGL